MCAALSRQVGYQVLGAVGTNSLAIKTTPVIDHACDACVSVGRLFFAHCDLATFRPVPLETGL